MLDTEFKVDDRVRIIVGGPHENFGRMATVGRIQENGDVVIYFGDQDEDEWVYSPSELVHWPSELENIIEPEGFVGWAVLAKRPDRAGTAFEHDFASSLHRTLLGAETSQMIATDKTEAGCDKFGNPVEYVLAEVRVIPGRVEARGEKTA